MATNMHRILDRHRVTSGKGFRLKHHDPADTGGRLVTQSAAEAIVAQDAQRLSHCMIASMPETNGPSCAYSRRWMPAARTARSST